MEGPDRAIVKELQARIDKKMKELEIETIRYWKGLLDRVVSKKPEGIASLQLEIKKISSMMENRISILKKER